MKPLLTLAFKCVLATSSGLSVMAVAGDHHHSPLEFSSEAVTENIIMLQGKGGNIGLLTGEQGLLMVDDDYGEMSQALSSALEAYGGEKQLTYIINTHWHGDHTQGNKVFGQFAPIVAHDNVRQRLLTRNEVKLFGLVSEPYEAPALPSITYQQQLTLYINSEQVQLLYLGHGHTDGDSIVWFKSANVIHMGDFFFNGFFPFVDLAHGGNVLTLAKNIEKLLPDMPDDIRIIPGHGPLASKADLQAYVDMLKGTSAEVQALKAKGLSLSAIQQQGLSDQWAPWTDGFISVPVWIEIVYSSLSDRKPHQHK